MAWSSRTWAISRPVSRRETSSTNAKSVSDGENTSNYQNPEYDKLFEQLKSLDDGPQKQAVIDRDFQAMLDDPRMTERVDETMRNRLVPSCNVPGRGTAFPPRRLVRVAQAIGPGRETVQSICQDSFRPAASAIARLVGRRACRRFEP